MSAPASHPALPTAVDVTDATGRLAPEALDWLRRSATAAAAHLGHPAGGELRARVVADPEMAAAHARFSGVQGTTDVLTFDLTEGASGTRPAAGAAALDADILLCLDEARRQAGARGIAVERELLLYFVHAALHCLGEDDTNDAAAASMHAREDALLCAIGVGVTFAAPEVPS